MLLTTVSTLAVYYRESAKLRVGQGQVEDIFLALGNFVLNRVVSLCRQRENMGVSTLYFLDITLNLANKYAFTLH